MDKKGAVLLAVALVLAVVAGGTVYLYLKGVPATQASAPETVGVVVAVKDMTFGTTLEEGDLHVAQFPNESVPMGSFASIDSIVGQTTKVFVVTGEPLLASKLSGIGGGLSVRIEPHMRAMSLRVNDVTGVSGFVLPGDRVDVIVTVQNAAGGRVAITKTILQSVEVLAAGVKTENKKQNMTVQTVTLLVEPNGAEKLALAVNQGKIHLALRNPVDYELVEGGVTNTKTVLGLNKPKRTRRRSSKKPTKVVTTKKAPVPFEPSSFTIIRDGVIVKQESLTKDSEEGSKRK